jgi:hypothetical protein
MSKMGNYVVGAEEDGTIVFNEQTNCYESQTEKLDFEVMIRPRVADCSHSDVIVVPAFDIDDAFERTERLLKNGAHSPDLGKSVDYIVKGVISPGDELYGLDEPCDCGRASVYIGCSYIIPSSI